MSDSLFPAEWHLNCGLVSCALVSLARIAMGAEALQIVAFELFPVEAHSPGPFHLMVPVSLRFHAVDLQSLYVSAAGADVAQ